MRTKFVLNLSGKRPLGRPKRKWIILKWSFECGPDLSGSG